MAKSLVGHGVELGWLFCCCLHTRAVSPSKVGDVWWEWCDNLEHYNNWLDLRAFFCSSFPTLVSAVGRFLRSFFKRKKGWGGAWVWVCWGSLGRSDWMQSCNAYVCTYKGRKLLTTSLLVNVACKLKPQWWRFRFYQGWWCQCWLAVLLGRYGSVVDYCLPGWAWVFLVIRFSSCKEIPQNNTCAETKHVTYFLWGWNYTYI